MRWLRVGLPVLIFALAAGGWLLGAAPKAAAVSASDWRPGRIIDDSVFMNSNAMSATAVRDFINGKIPACSSGVTCLRNYYENPSNKKNNLDGRPIPNGAIPAYQIIWQAGQDHGINPQVLLATLQKESSLVTLTAPGSWRFRTAMGYGCPDTAPCNAQYYGFYNQMNKAASQFRRYINYPQNYNFAVGNRFILWHPDQTTADGDRACGGRTVFIETAATAALYNYTPYQPNQAALNNLYGKGDDCSAYGNRNFWRLFNDWFGSTHGVSVHFYRFDSNSDTTGEQARLGVRLSKRPTANVTIPFVISSPSNAAIRGPDSITITPDNWDDFEKNIITIVGLDNPALTGTHQYWLQSGRPISEDGRYAALGGDQVGHVPLVQAEADGARGVYRLYSSELKQHFFTASKLEREAKLADGWVSEGIRFRYCPAGEQTVYRVKRGDERRLVLEGSPELSQALSEGFSIESVNFALSPQATVPVYWRYDPDLDRHLYTTSANEGLSDGFDDDRGVAFYACAGGEQPVYRIYKPDSAGHFYTATPAERDKALYELGFRYEQLAFYVCGDGTRNVYRLYAPSTRDHFLTASVEERVKAVNSQGYLYEGVGFRLCEDAEREVFRLYRPSTGSHFFTTSVAERVKAVNSQGYLYEGVGFKVE